ncbi:MAG TPA: A24 family peptidase [Candidatus Binatia bacterium]|nr:A24 family peptidase [Candidatus Binatia bacterium]
MDGALLVALAGIIGLGFGYAADRLASRWPEHEDGSVRARDWRTWVVVVTGGVAFAATVARFGANPVHLGVVFAYVAVLVVLFAIDLDQRLLPNVLTYPLVAYAIAVFLLGASPFVRSNDDLLWAGAAAVLVPAGLFVLALPFGRGAIGEGDLKLLVSVGLFAGATKLIHGLIVGAVAAGVIVAVLVFVRRLSMRSFVPYGPFLIAGTLWAILALPQP